MSEVLQFRDAMGSVFSFNGLSEVETFFQNEGTVWEQKLKPLEDKSSFLRSIPGHIENFLLAYKNHRKGGNASNWSAARRAFTDWTTENWIVSTNSVNEILIAAFERSQVTGDTCWGAIKHQRVNLHNASMDTFIGAIAAYGRVGNDSLNKQPQD